MGDPDYATLIQLMADAMMVVDLTGGICSANAAAGRLFRCPEEQLLGLHVEDLIPPPALQSQNASLKAPIHPNAETDGRRAGNLGLPP